MTNTRTPRNAYSIDADRANHEPRVLGRRQGQDGEHALPIDPLVIGTAPRKADLGLETTGLGRKPARRPGVQPKLTLDDEFAFDRDDLAHSAVSGRISLATEMLRFP